MMRKVGFGANALRGTTYSIRCVIKGARKTGKTQLANLLRGFPFVSQYTPTATLQSCEIDMDINGTQFSYLHIFMIFLLIDGEDKVQVLVCCLYICSF